MEMDGVVTGGLGGWRGRYLRFFAIVEALGSVGRGLLRLEISRTSWTKHLWKRDTGCILFTYPPAKYRTSTTAFPTRSCGLFSTTWFPAAILIRRVGTLIQGSTTGLPQR